MIAWWGTDAPNEQMELGINQGDEIYWTGEYNEADFTTPVSFADDSWHQLVVTYDGATRTAVGYLDGTLLGSRTLGSGWDTTLDATGLTIGGPEYHGYYLDADLDDVAVYGHALSPARVLAHYAASRLAGLATTTYSYDAAGRVASRTDADGRTMPDELAIEKSSCQDLVQCMSVLMPGFGGDPSQIDPDSILPAIVDTNLIWWFSKNDRDRESTVVKFAEELYSLGTKKGFKGATLASYVFANCGTSPKET